MMTENQLLNTTWLRDQETESFIRETAQAIVYAHRLEDDDPWLRSLGQGNEPSAQAVLENWICQYIHYIPKQMRDPMFRMLYSEFEALYYGQEVFHDQVV